MLMLVVLLGAIVPIRSAVAGGQAPQPLKRANAQDSSGQPPSGNSANGKKVFHEHCEMCHEAESTADKVGPGLKGLSHKAAHKLPSGKEHRDHSAATIREQIEDGSGTMPPQKGALSEQEIQDLIAYLQTL